MQVQVLFLLVPNAVAVGFLNGGRSATFDARGADFQNFAEVCQSGSPRAEGGLISTCNFYTLEDEHGTYKSPI